MGRIVKLIMVTASNNNKYYNMFQEDDSTWRCEYGRVGGSCQTMRYSMSQWDKKYKEKVKKGYRDVTELVSLEKESDSDDQQFSIKGAKPSVVELVNFLQSAAKGTIKKNYTVSVADVTQKQVDAAQEILDALIGLSRESSFNIDAINKTLLDMYQVIPRKMNDTRKYLLQADSDQSKFQRLLSNEQDLLDVMAGQVMTQTPKGKTATDEMDLADFGLHFDMATDADIEAIRKGTDLKIDSVGKIFVVRHGATADSYEKKFQSSSTSKEMLFYHGSRNENWWSILNTGLKIRPSNAIHTGSMFGDGIYFANKARKSIGYTSLRGSYWASGSSGKAYLALFQVNIGKTWPIFANGQRHNSSHYSLNQRTVEKNGYDSVFAQGGADLRNDEYIVYEEGRATVKYLIELKG